MDLLAHAFRHGAPHPAAVGFVVIGLPLVLRVEHLFEIFRLRQRARMRDQDSFSAAFHVYLRKKTNWSVGVLEYWTIASRNPSLQILQHSIAPCLPVCYFSLL